MTPTDLLAYALLGFGVVVGGWLAVRHRPLYPLLPFRHNFRRRRKTLQRALALLDERGAKTLVETGSARGGLEAARREGASTVVFSLWAKRRGAVLHSVDLSEDSVEAARRAVTDAGTDDVVRFHVGDSVDFLRGFSDPVDFLYLDSFDYDTKDPAGQRASQEHHLREFEAIESRLHEKSIVLIDDCALPGGGKGKLAIERMKERGWRPVVSAYQVLLVRG